MFQLPGRQNLRVLLALLLLPGCRELGDLGLVEGTPRERYERALARARLDSTALGLDWTTSGRTALSLPVSVSLPFNETGYFPAERPRAVSYKFEALRGQQVLVHLQIQSSEPAQVFLDLFSAVDSNRAADPVVSADSGGNGLEVEIEESGPYILRVQPELLRAVRYTISLRSTPVLGFPVEGVSNEAIRSRWGADRDAGRRRHEGIDIFAPRGTPVLAATPGRVANVGENRLGGRVVWLRDGDRNQNLYYAHLDRQIVREGEVVEKGDTLGFVGNTGNARTTPPHLHFGIYRRGEGAIDPLPFVYRTPAGGPALVADSGRIGSWVRVTSRRAVLSGSTAVPDTLAGTTVAWVFSAAGDRYRVELPDGRIGFLGERITASASVPLSRNVLSRGARLLNRPDAAALLVDSIMPRSRVDVLGSFNEFQLVRTEEGTIGWISR